ncbi:protein lingerer-like isoform X7 [Dermacentor albipictus]|uniref:protein lingerer-like isoform X7 n=1 Tax=Dermacentor albipictus TaxID=60249 RepID=UPI0031FD6569
MSSSNTQRAGKSSRDRGNKSPSTATTQSPKAVTATDGHAKPPDGFIPKVQPTPEQIRLAQIINDPTKQDDPDIRNKVNQVMEVTGQSSDAVVIALHDCDNDPARAITMLIEGNKQEGEWETRGKKKKPVKEGNQQQQQQQKGDQSGPASSNKENRGGPRGEGGPPRNVPRGSGGGRGGGRGGSWKNKEIEKNERNLEDGRSGERTGDMRPRGGSRRGGRGGRGGGVGGGRGSRTFQNRGLGSHDGFPQSMDTWTNSTSAGGQRASRGGQQQQQQQQDAMPVGNWNDLAVSEDWSEEDWTGQLETKVFTASGVAANPPPAPDTASIIQLLKESPHESISVAQYNQQATESIKAAVGVGSAANSVTSSSYPVAQTASSADVSSVTTSKPVPASQRTKTPRVRVPPPSKIPESAVEMPDDSAVSSLEVQFGGLEFGTDTFDFGAADGLAAVSTAQPTMPPGLVQNEQAAVTSSVPSSTPYLDGHHGVSKVPSSTVSSSPAGSLGASSVASKDVAPATAGAVPQPQSQPPQQQSQQQSLPSQPAAAPPRPPGIPAPKEPQGLGNSVAPAGNALGSVPASSATSAGVAASATSSASHKPGSVMAPEHLLLQSQSHSERSKPVSSSSVAGPQSKMYAGGAAAQRNSQGLEGGLSAGKVEQPMYSSAGGAQHYSSGAYPGGGGKGLVGSYLAHSQGFPSSTTGAQQQQQHYYAAQQPQPTSSTTAAFSQQQSNGYQGPYQSNAYSGPSQPQQANYGVSSKLSASAGLGPHSVKDSVLDSSQQGTASQHNTYENSHVPATATGLPSGPASTLATTASSLAGATATTSVLKNSMSATGKTMPTMPPGVPTAMLGHQFLVGNAAMPYYGLQQQPLYSYEDLQVLQTRMPHLGYYDMQYPVPATSLAGRDLTLNNMAYAESNKFGRGENSDSSPGTVAGVGPQGAAAGAAAAAQGGAQGGQQGAPPTAGQQAAASQQFLNTLPPGYGYYFPSNLMPGSIHHYGPPPMFPFHAVRSDATCLQRPTPTAPPQARSFRKPVRMHPTRSPPSFEKPGFLTGSQSSAAAVASSTAAAGHQQQPGGSSYPQFVGPRGSPPSLAKQQQQQPGGHIRQGYPYWGN